VKEEISMAEEFRKPELKKQNGFCSFQNGTYEQVSNNDAWNCIEPILNMINANNKFYRLIELGSEPDVKPLIDELLTLTAQIGKMVVKIKKANGKVFIPDAEYFKEKFDSIYKELENIPYKRAKILEKEFARELAVEFRHCVKVCVAHNYNETLFLNSHGVNIEIPQEKSESMQRIADEMAVEKAQTPRLVRQKKWSDLRI